MKKSNLRHLVLGFILTVVTGSVWASSISNFCWKNSYGRGAGKPLTQCSGNLQKSGALCYPKCKSGYTGVGPVCWQKCPSGFRNDGAFCAKPKSYGRGAGFPWKFGDAMNDKGMRKRCEKRHGKGKCEKHGAIFYPKCRHGFHAVGCCVCSPNCVAGQKDIGVSCAKKSYGRGIGKPLKCASGLEQNGALCYKKCKAKYTGVGPVCWGQPPRGWVNCGMGAANTKRNCTSAVISQVTSVGNLALTVATLGSSTGAT